MANRQTGRILYLASSLLVCVTAAAVPPANDGCDNAAPVSPDQSVSGTLIDATTDGACSCESSGNADVWYSFEAPSAGTLTVTTCGTNDAPGLDRGMDSVLSLHRGCPGTEANEIVCNDNWFAAGVGDACAADDAGVRTDSVAATSLSTGESVLIRVTWKQLFLRDGLFTLHIAFEPTGITCPCEIDGLATVDIFDLLGYLDLWFGGDPGAERDGQQGVDIFDLLVFLACWFAASAGEGCP